MKTLQSSRSVQEVPGYAELQHQIHVALRAQHPEWVQPNGDSPTCDSYELRFAELLRQTDRRTKETQLDMWSAYARDAYRDKEHRLSQAGSSRRIVSA
jgi:hypothetical protein